MTTITPGYILTDDDGDSIGLTIAEVAAIVGEWDVPGSPENRAARSEFHVGDLGITWYRYGDSKGRGMVLTRNDHDTYVTAEAIALLRGILASQERPAPAAPSPDMIDVRIRVGVTASGEWSSCGGSQRVIDAYTYDSDLCIADDLSNASEDVAAWHWITARIPMPVVERGDVAGEVES